MVFFYVFAAMNGCMKAAAGFRRRIGGGSGVGGLLAGEGWGRRRRLIVKGKKK